MKTKFPKQALKKWSRYTKFEKIFILYCIILLVVSVSLPIITYKISMTNEDFIKLYMRDMSMIKTFVVFAVLFIFLILWNISFRFKRIINILIWFKESDALMNFVVLLVMSLQFLTIWDITVLLKDRILWDSLILTNRYYIIWIWLILWLAWNLLIALDISKIKKKSQIVNVMNQSNDEEEKKQDEKLKWLFDEDPQ